jgi:hypothetical protein
MRNPQLAIMAFNSNLVICPSLSLSNFCKTQHTPWSPHQTNTHPPKTSLSSAFKHAWALIIPAVPREEPASLNRGPPAAARTGPLRTKKASFMRLRVFSIPNFSAAESQNVTNSSGRNVPSPE